MAYQKTDWVEYETVVSAENLNKVENQLEVLTGDIGALAGDVNALTTDVNENASAIELVQEQSARMSKNLQTTMETVVSLGEVTQNNGNSITSHSNEFLPHDDALNYTVSAADSNGIYTIVTYKRADATTYMVSTLSNPDSNGNYQTCVWNFYEASGTAVALTKTWTLVYDNNGVVTSATIG